MMTNLKKRKFGLNSLSLAVTVALAGSVMSTAAMAEDEEVAKMLKKLP